MTLEVILVYKPFGEKEGSSVDLSSIDELGHHVTQQPHAVYKAFRGKQGSSVDQLSNRKTRSHVVT